MAQQRTRAAATPQLEPSPGKLQNNVVEQALLTGQYVKELDALFGEAGHEELARLARQASASRRRGGPKVMILPGIMGSKLGKIKSILGIEYNDVYWLDPVEFVFGIAQKLALDDRGDPAVVAVGTFLSVYLRLKLNLLIAGYDASFHPFDWRQDIKGMGNDLKDAIGDQKVSLVAHSMGGLVARAALKAGASVDRLIMLGTPNYGSFAPVQALRGVYSIVKTLAIFDVKDTANDLAGIFATFPGLCQMLPASARYPAINFFAADSWPTTGPAVLPDVLKASDDVQDQLADADDSFYLIAGFNQSTVVGASLTDDRSEFQYDSSLAGDGTVPLRFALLENLKATQTYYVEESHGSLPNNGTVIQAVKDILAEGKTAALPNTPPATRRAGTVRITEKALRMAKPFGGRSGSELRVSEGRALLADVAAPLIPQAPGAAPPLTAPDLAPAAEEYHWQALTVARARQHRLEIHLANCSISDVDARAYVLGLFREVTPSGAASALDQRLGGVISEFTQRRMFGGNVGEIFILPANRSMLRTDMILFAGLGTYDSFDRANADVLQSVAENVLRALIRTHVEDLATILFGASSDSTIPQVMENLLRGFIRAKIDADADQHFRRVVLCELDRDRYLKMKSELYRLASTPLFENIEVSITELSVRPVLAPVLETPQQAGTRQQAQGPEPIYLMTRQESPKDDEYDFRISLLPPSSKAAILSDTTYVKKADLDGCLEKIANLKFSDLADFGAEWAKLVLPDTIRQALPLYQDHHLVIVHDADSSRLPWETLYLENAAPALGTGMSHRYLADNLSVAKYLEKRRQEPRLHVLLIVDPTGTLEGAEAEADRIFEVLTHNPQVHVEKIKPADGSRQRIIKEISSGNYDVLHYAGHAFFDPDNRSQSGIPVRQRAEAHRRRPEPAGELAEPGVLQRLRIGPHSRHAKSQAEIRRHEAEAPGEYRLCRSVPARRRGELRGHLLARQRRCRQALRRHLLSDGG